ncbi:unnamed protein product [Zymoseptoria tritici ST99CH_3D1]|nr:unnamed protein product [Zymoseptoria tritici ST99CH_3D1]
MDRKIHTTLAKKDHAAECELTCPAARISGRSCNFDAVRRPVRDDHQAVLSTIDTVLKGGTLAFCSMPGCGQEVTGNPSTRLEALSKEHKARHLMHLEDVHGLDPTRLDSLPS